MTLKEAQMVLRVLEPTPMSKMTPTQKRVWHQATVVVRTHRKPLRNPRAKAVVIYGRVLRVEAQKIGKHRCDPGCKKANHCYYHPFKGSSNVVAYGLPDGSVLLKGNKRIWGKF